MNRLLPRPLHLALALCTVVSSVATLRAQDQPQAPTVTTPTAPTPSVEGRTPIVDASELQLVLLKLVSEQPRHGYDLIRAIEELTGGAYSPSPGVVYPTLTLLSEMGHIREDQSEGSRKTYAVTPDGQAFLDARKTEVTALMARLAEMASERARFDNVPVRRAMMNLRAVLMHRLGEETVKPETLHAVTAIIDEAAQRIERL